MSSVTKPSTLRLIVPKILAQRTLTSLSPFGKTDAKELVLSTGGLTTDNVVRYIREYTKLRDEIGQTIRQLGIERDPEPATPEFSDLKTAYSDAESQAVEARGEYQKLQAKLDAIDRQLQEVDRKVISVDQLKATGFSYKETMSGAAGFRRILGRLPAKKLDAAQKALYASSRDTAFMTTGTRKGDTVYVLVATPTDEVAQTLQTLLLYDFVQTEIPAFDGSDFEEALNTWRTRKDELTREKQSVESSIQDLRKSFTRPLNQSIDKIGETLLALRGSLRLGEGTSTAYIFARLDKPPGPVTLSALQKDGVLEQD
jgi:prefoldin subunit 5